MRIICRIRYLWPQQRLQNTRLRPVTFFLSTLTPTPTLIPIMSQNCRKITYQDLYNLVVYMNVRQKSRRPSTKKSPILSTEICHKFDFLANIYTLLVPFSLGAHMVHILQKEIECSTDCKNLIKTSCGHKMWFRINNNPPRKNSRSRSDI